MKWISLGKNKLWGAFNKDLLQKIALCCVAIYLYTMVTQEKRYLNLIYNGGALKIRKDAELRFIPTWSYEHIPGFKTSTRAQTQKILIRLISSKQINKKVS